jgi:pimeloyl-ACP methyl ester carboxylesterase
LSQTVSRKFCAEPAGTVAERGGPLIRWHRSSFDGSSQPYALYVPAAYDPSRSWPLVLSLHGFSSDHILNLRRVLGRGNAPDEPDCHAKSCFPELPDVDFLIASPYGFGSLWYEGPAETDVLDVLSDVRANYTVDPDRIYLTGLSMGGAGAWHLAVRHPHLFAAVAPVCGPSDYRLFASHESLATSFAEELLAAHSPINLAGNLAHVPAKIFHGTLDDLVRVEHSRSMAQRLRELGCHVEYVEFPEVGHDAWNLAYGDGAILHWFRMFERVSLPRSVDFSTPSLRWPGAYWVRVRQIETRPRLATIRAEIRDGNVIQVATANVAAFDLRLDLAPVDPKSDLTVSWNGEEAFRGRPHGAELSFGEVGAGLRKRAGLEGPVGDAFRDPYVLVYGTQGDDSEAIRAGREAAERAADPGEWGDIEIPIKPDSDVTGDDIGKFNLILFGNPRTNALIARVNEHLPVRFDSDWVQSGRRLLTGHDMGLIVVYPNPLNPDRCVALIGGDTAATIRMAAENRENAPDYIVFDGSSDFTDETTLRDWGYFSNRWAMGDG